MNTEAVTLFSILIRLEPQDIIHLSLTSKTSNLAIRIIESESFWEFYLENVLGCDITSCFGEAKFFVYFLVRDTFLKYALAEDPNDTTFKKLVSTNVINYARCFCRLLKANTKLLVDSFRAILLVESTKYNDSIVVLGMLLKEKIVDLNKHEGLSVLLECITKNHHYQVRLLLNRKYNFVSPCIESKAFPLAISLNRFAIVKRLVESGQVDVTYNNNEAVEIANQKGYVNILRYLTRLTSLTNKEKVRR